MLSHVYIKTKETTLFVHISYYPDAVKSRMA